MFLFTGLNNLISSIRNMCETLTCMLGITRFDMGQGTKFKTKRIALEKLECLYGMYTFDLDLPEDYVVANDRSTSTLEFISEE